MMPRDAAADGAQNRMMTRVVTSDAARGSAGETTDGLRWSCVQHRYEAEAQGRRRAYQASVDLHLNNPV
jgi:hypothetical protein